MENIIEYRNVGKSYNGKPIFENFNLEIEDGSFISMIGSSGSGKTTLLKMINGLIEPDRGDIFIRGKKVKDYDLIALRRRIGYAIQGNGLFTHMNVEENIGFVPGIEGKSKSEINAQVDKMLELVDLPLDIKKRNVELLSGGQQQRVGIARAYANEPSILLMDEPFGAVDAITRYQLQKDIMKIHRQTGCTIIFITHDILEALKISDKILVLDKGRIEQFGTPADILEDPETEFVSKLVEMAKYNMQIWPGDI